MLKERLTFRSTVVVVNPPLEPSEYTELDSTVFVHPVFIGVIGEDLESSALRLQSGLVEYEETSPPVEAMLVLPDTIDICTKYGGYDPTPFPFALRRVLSFFSALQFLLEYSQACLTKKGRK